MAGQEELKGDGYGAWTFFWIRENVIFFLIYFYFWISENVLKTNDEYTKNHRTVYFKWAYCILCEVYLKVVFKKHKHK